VAAAPAPVAPTAERRPEVRTPSAPAASSTSSENDEQRRAQPRGSRPRGDNPTTGRAVPRDGHFGDGHRDDGRHGGTIFTPRSHGRIFSGTRVYNNYYYYPRRWYPYGYGAFGLGYFYYDPYTWYSYDPYYPRYYGGGYYGGYGGGYGSSYGDGYSTGELRLDVEPKYAEVYVDGYFAGHVDDFDGMFQALRLEDGPYKIEIVAPGYEPLEFDIRIQPGRKITYRRELRRIP
jgi:hypothetical protein